MERMKTSRDQTNFYDVCNSFLRDHADEIALFDSKT